MAEARIEAVNDDTGEVFSGRVTQFDPRNRPPKARFDAPWMAVFDAGLEALMDARLTVSDVRVFYALLARSTTTGEQWEIRAELISDRLGMDLRRVRRGVAAIVEAGLLTRPRKGWVAFNPDMFWRGTSEARARAMKNLERAAELEVEAALQTWTRS